ncbi:hypothetical protein [Altericroceibacterium xinjiangense]|uniref:hypothetical protein n=1 Tax=Altericroceibacterium xinjiangense TaxID=762261 RepID=UPI000F7D8EA2|nr:hypothetical protein [Altericroceibacterium xinjiangense]
MAGWALWKLAGRGSALCAALAGLGEQAAARETVVEPASKWVLNYAPERCSLIRIFGIEDETLRFELESFGGRRFYRALLAGRPVPRTSDPAGAIKLRLQEPNFRRTDALHGSANDIPAVSFLIEFAPPDETGEERRARQPLPPTRPGSIASTSSSTVARLRFTSAAWPCPC